MNISTIDEVEFKNFVYNNFYLAKKNMEQNNLVKVATESAISDRIPNYCAKNLKFSFYEKDSFVALFVDVRNSTKRLAKIGLNNTFLTMHAILPSMIYITELYGGYIVDIPGDGIMALFKNNPKKLYWEQTHELASDKILAISCADDIFKIHKNIINHLLNENSIDPVDIGIGLDSGEVIVTKIGTDKNYDTKAIGDCINNASKNSSGFNQIMISKVLWNSISLNERTMFTTQCSTFSENIKIAK